MRPSARRVNARGYRRAGAEQRQLPTPPAILGAMALRRFFRPGSPSEPASDATGPSAPGDSETATVRRIVAELEALPPERSRFLAGFAYVLSRAAHADLDISDEETRAMERIVMEFGHLPESQAVLVVEMAKNQTRLYGGTEDYLVTREFRDATSEEQRLDVLRCCFAVGAADTSISAEESAEINQIGDELGVDRTQVNAIRAEYREQLAVIQAMRRGASDGDRP